MYILSGLLVLGFVSNWLIRQVSDEHHMTPEEAAEEKKGANDTHEHIVEDMSALASEASHSWRVSLAWLAVGLPLAWGVWITVEKTIVLFK
jgi:hypothetical protein